MKKTLALLAIILMSSFTAVIAQHSYSCTENPYTQDNYASLTFDHSNSSNIDYAFLSVEGDRISDGNYDNLAFISSTSDFSEFSHAFTADWNTHSQYIVMWWILYKDGSNSFREVTFDQYGIVSGDRGGTM